MMLASLSRFRLRAYARLLLARRAVARRTDRSGGAGLGPETWVPAAQREPIVRASADATARLRKPRRHNWTVALRPR